MPITIIPFADFDKNTTNRRADSGASRPADSYGPDSRVGAIHDEFVGLCGAGEVAYGPARSIDPDKVLSVGLLASGDGVVRIEERHLPNGQWTEALAFSVTPKVPVCMRLTCDAPEVRLGFAAERSSMVFIVSQQRTA